MWTKKSSVCEQTKMQSLLASVQRSQARIQAKKTLNTLLTKIAVLVGCKVADLYVAKMQACILHSFRSAAA